MFKIQPYGDKAVLVTFSDSISEKIQNTILNYSNELKKCNILGIENHIPAYNTITVNYNPLSLSIEELICFLEEIKFNEENNSRTSLIKIPVCYHKDFAIDMEDVISKTGLSKSEIISKHTSPIYDVHMIGFMPGFFYLGGLDEALYCARKKTPRLTINEGSVGIGGRQTGVYPLDGPGGWQIIGRTPKKIFDKSNLENPFLVKQGDKVQFHEISLETYKKIQNG